MCNAEKRRQLLELGLATAQAFLYDKKSPYSQVFGKPRLNNANIPPFDEQLLKKQGLTNDTLRQLLRVAIAQPIKKHLELQFALWKKNMRAEKQHLDAPSETLTPKEKYELANQAKDALLRELVIATIIDLSNLLDADPISSSSPYSPSGFVGEN